MALVLVVDDAPLARHALSRLLTQAGHAVIVAGDAKEAVRALEEHQPELVLLDLDLADADGGFTVLDVLAAQPGPRPAVLVITGLLDDGLRRRAEALGALGYFVKGEFVPAALLDRIAQLVEGQ